MAHGDERNMALFLADQSLSTFTGHEVEVSDSFKLFRATMVDIFYSQWQKTGCLEQGNRAYEDAMSNQYRESLFQTDKDIVLELDSGSVQCKMQIHRISIGNCFLFKRENRFFHSFFLDPPAQSWLMQCTKNETMSPEKGYTLSIWLSAQKPATLHFKSRVDAWEIMCFMFSRKTLFEIEAFNGVRNGPFIYPSVFNASSVLGCVMVDGFWNPCTICVDRIGCFICCTLKLQNGSFLEFLLSDRYGIWGYQYQAKLGADYQKTQHFVTFSDIILNQPFCDMVFEDESDVAVLFNLLLT